jgi:hypothetical protein
MQKPIGYDEAAAITPGEYKQLPPGGYIGKIVRAEETTSKSGNNMIVLDVDIAEGEYKDFFKQKYDTRFSDETPWGAKVRQVVDGASTPMFKGLVTSIEASNLNFAFPFAPAPLTRLHGKQIGLIFGREEYIASDGEIRMATRVRGVRAVSTIRNGVEPPLDILLNKPQKQGGASALKPVYNEDLPF